jgi:hypothetical protein
MHSAALTGTTLGQVAATKMVLIGPALLLMTGSIATSCAHAQSIGLEAHR